MATKISESLNIPVGSSSVTPQTEINLSSTRNDNAKSPLMAAHEKGLKPSRFEKNRKKRRKRSSISPDDLTAEWTNNVELGPTFSPTVQEFENPVSYLNKISPEASDYGICKIVSPLHPLVPPSKVLKEDPRLGWFKAEYLPLRAGFTETTYETNMNYTINTFKEKAQEWHNKKWAALKAPFLVEREFWKAIAKKKGGWVEHVDGIEATAFSSDPRDPLGKSKWNLKDFAQLPRSALGLLDSRIPKVSDPRVSLGMMFSYEYWHAEPGHLYRIDYNHFGKPRTWYGSPNCASNMFERAVRDHVFPQEGLEKFEAYDILNFKKMLFSPNILLKRNVPVYKIIQKPGEFIITFPKSYHMAFSHGYSCWETVNFATPYWFPFGDEASERRALYIREQDVPYQEMLCKEAINLVDNKSELKLSIYHDMKINFACLIKLHDFARKEIVKRGARVMIFPRSKEAKFCGFCNRECYLAYVKCKCFPKPICIFHEIYKKCPCKGSRVMVVINDVLAMETIAHEFEESDEKLMVEVLSLVIKRALPFGSRTRNELHRYVYRCII